VYRRGALTWCQIGVLTDETSVVFDPVYYRCPHFFIPSHMSTPPSSFGLVRGPV